jgi:ornithine cyclodeaminase/alanine dehydrogenase-like protein (mu-crystallin family)
MRRSKVVADNPAEVLKTSGDFASHKSIVCSLGGLVQQDNDKFLKQFENADIRLFKSVGTAIQDMFISNLALKTCYAHAQIVHKL